MRISHPHFNPISWFNFLRIREIGAYEQGVAHSMKFWASAYNRLKKENRCLRLKLKELNA